MMPAAVVGSSGRSFHPPKMVLPARATRRSATRRAVVLPCQAVRERDFKLVADRTLDVSVEGMLLPIEETILTGETLIVSFPIGGMWIDAEATVARIIHGRRPGDDGLAMGVVFDVMSASSRAALAGFLHKRPPPLPRRGPLSCMRRGLAAPQLADCALMEAVDLAPRGEEHSDLDVIDLDADENVGAGVAFDEPLADDFDALGALREVAAAWKRLVLPS